MPLQKIINWRAITTDQSGFGDDSDAAAGRFYKKNGTANKKIKGIPFWDRISVYHYLITISWAKFLLLLFMGFIFMNLLFAGVYYMIGIEQLDGLNHNSWQKEFAEVIFFSSQTFTTVGYGRINPVGLVASAVASFEAMTGLLSFAIATGLMYGRFSQPKAFIKFSKKALVTPYKGGLAVMVRLVPYKNHHLSEGEVKATLAIKVPEEGTMHNKFFPLKLEISNINNLVLSWTIVHVIDEESPFNNLNQEDLINGEAELLVYVKTFDETFSNYVKARSSYIGDEFVFGAKFNVMYHPSNDHHKTIVQIDLLDSYDKVDL